MGLSRRFPTRFQASESLGSLCINYVTGMGASDCKLFSNSALAAPLILLAQTVATAYCAARCAGLGYAASEIGYAVGIQSTYFSSYDIGPFKWVVASKLAMNFIVVAGDAEDLLKNAANCWEQVIPDQKFPPQVQQLHATNGMLLRQLATFCTPLKTRVEGVDGEILILKNKAGALYVFLRSHASDGS